MNFRKHALILEVIRALNNQKSWTGKTHLQKALFLLSLNHPEGVDFRFVLYKHGPYSFDVEAELAKMQLYGAVEIVPDDRYGVNLKPGRGERQIPEPVVNQLLEKIDSNEIERACEEVAGLNVGELEALSTAAWVVKREGVHEKEAAATRILELKPHLDRKVVDSMLDEVAVFFNIDM